ncbi:MAG: hypothetical protein RBU37_17800 [Myxococcota bacterium]|jgi:DNA/RNA-binding domain of Phe-tRNA-synthetase-like protein|nr:hypothetical protein [Myxococcota bacterium]
MPKLSFSPELPPAFSLGLLSATVFTPAAAQPEAALHPELAECLAEIVARGERAWAAERASEVRKMLRFGRYRPSGRAKPASEFLLRAALEGTFPVVMPAVDVNNLSSVESGYPCSIIDAGRIEKELVLRRGREGECYSFNASGQVIALEDLLLVAESDALGGRPVANPVKDPMYAKLQADSRQLVAFVFAPRTESALQQCCQRFAERLERICGAVNVAWEIIENGHRH